MTRNRLLCAALLAFAIALGASCSSDSAERDESGEVVEEGDVSAFSVQVGDCFEDAGAGVVSDIPAVPCDEPHDLEAYANFDLEDGDFPGLTEVETQAQTGCEERFPDYVGIDYASSSLAVFVITPTQQSWDVGDDREVVCAVYDINGEKLTGSVKGSGR